VPQAWAAGACSPVTSDPRIGREYSQEISLCGSGIDLLVQRRSGPEISRTRERNLPTTGDSKFTENGTSQRTVSDETYDCLQYESNTTTP